jgi:hypothetical protein
VFAKIANHVAARHPVRQLDALCGIFAVVKCKNNVPLVGVGAGCDGVMQHKFGFLFDFKKVLSMAIIDLAFGYSHLKVDCLMLIR